MPQRRADSDDRDASFRDRLFAFLERDRRGDVGGGRGGARSGGSRGRDPPARGARGKSTAADAQSARQGDWRCTCGFFPNFGHRRTCYSCGKPRADLARGGGGRSAGSLLGPVGAGGLRPQLAWASAKAAATTARDSAPTFRVPGASVAARASAARASGTQRAAKPGGAINTASEGGQALAAGSAVPPTDDLDGDDDGFQTVPPRGRARKKLGGGGGPGGATADADDDDAMDDGDGATTRQLPPEGADGEDGGGDADATAAPDPAQLRRRWQEEIAVVKALGQQGLPEAHPALVAACSARDAAERAWREAKDPTPLSVRLSRVQAKLDRAIALQADTRAAMQKLEGEYKAQLAVLEEKMAEDRERVRLRRQQLEQVQAEAGAGVGGGDEAQHAGRAAARKVHNAMCNQMAPAIAALVEQVDSESQAWQVLNGLLCQLATSQHELQQAFEPQAPSRPQQQRSQSQQQQQRPSTYDIGDNSVHEHGADGDASDWSESHDLRGQVNAAADNDGWGPWTYPPADAAQDQDQTMGSDEWWDEPRWKARTRWSPGGYGQWTRSSWADSWEEEHQDADDGGQSAAKHRRTHEPAPAPVTVAAESSAAGSAAAGGETEVAAAARLRQYNEKVEAIITRAIGLGIQPLTDNGEELQVLSPAQLDEWVAAKIPFG